MTAKQALMDYVAGLTEEEAAAKLPLIRDAGEPPALTPDQIDQVRRSLADLDAGRKTPHGDVKRRFGIA